MKIHTVRCHPDALPGVRCTFITNHSNTMKAASILRGFVALLALVVSSQVFAAGADYLLEIEGIKGECVGKHIKLTENADGSFAATDIPSGTYRLIAKPKMGDGSVKPARSSKPAVADMKAATVDFNFEYIVSPRDPASGQASGRRQQNMMAIQKLGVALEPAGVFVSEIVVTKMQDDGASSSGPRHTGYDLKVNKKV